MTDSIALLRRARADLDYALRCYDGIEADDAMMDAESIRSLLVDIDAALEPTPRKTAYLLAVIRNDRIDGFGVFSEPSPTIGIRRHIVVLATAERETYEEARARVLDRGLGIGQTIGPRCADALAKLATEPARSVRVEWPS